MQRGLWIPASWGDSIPMAGCAGNRCVSRYRQPGKQRYVRPHPKRATTRFHSHRRRISSWSDCGRHCPGTDDRKRLDRESPRSGHVPNIRGQGAIRDRALVRWTDVVGVWKGLTCGHCAPGPRRHLDRRPEEQTIHRNSVFHVTGAPNRRRESAGGSTVLPRPPASSGHRHFQMRAHTTETHSRQDR